MLPPQLRGPYGDDRESAQRPPERGVVTAPRTPEDAVRSYALLYTNWTWRTYPRVYAQMQARATGRQQQRVARTSPASGTFLRFLADERVTNRGTVGASLLLARRERRAEFEVGVDERPGGRGQVASVPFAHTYRVVAVRNGRRWLVDRFERVLER